MIELKITVDKAVELEQEVKDLYQSIVGAPVKDVEPVNWTTSDVKHAKQEASVKETPKVEATKEEPIEEKQEAPVKETPVKQEVPSLEEEAPAPKEEPETPVKEVPSLEATREAVKDVMAKADDKTKAKGEFKAFLDSIGAEKVTSATDEQRIQIMEWVASRG